MKIANTIFNVVNFKFTVVIFFNYEVKYFFSISSTINPLSEINTQDHGNDDRHKNPDVIPCGELCYLHTTSRQLVGTPL